MNNYRFIRFNTYSVIITRHHCWIVDDLLVRFLSFLFQASHLGVIHSLLSRLLSDQSPLCNLILRDPRNLFVFSINFSDRRNSRFRFPSTSFKSSIFYILYPKLLRPPSSFRYRSDFPGVLFFHLPFPFVPFERYAVTGLLRAFSTLVTLRSNKMHV